MKLTGTERLHFIGVGGAGMSAIAKVLLERGHAVSGSDLKRSRAATMLEAMGASIQIGHSAEFIAECAPDIVVVSSAIGRSNPELAWSRTHSIPVMTRGETLATVLEGLRSVVVAGTHGKTTTTSMIVSILRTAGRDPTYLVGGGLNDAGTNARAGRERVAIAESDESDGSFLLLAPDIAVLTNVEADHLDYWRTPEALMQGFGDFLRRVSPGGTIIVPTEERDVVDAARSLPLKVIEVGSPSFRAGAVRVTSKGSHFSIASDEGSADVILRARGDHNVLNALCAAAAAMELGVSLADAARGLSSFRGVERRFEIKGTAGGITVIDDYAHHPTEVRATLAAARPGPWQRVVAVFQPHRYSRTQTFHHQFGPAFALADRIVVTDVYGAGEEPVPGVTGKLIADAVAASLPGRPVAYLPHRADLVTYLESQIRPGDALVTLGAGDINAVGDAVLERLKAAM